MTQQQEEAHLYRRSVRPQSHLQQPQSSWPRPHSSPKATNGVAHRSGIPPSEHDPQLHMLMRVHKHMQMQVLLLCSSAESGTNAPHTCESSPQSPGTLLMNECYKTCPSQKVLLLCFLAGLCIAYAGDHNPPCCVVLLRAVSCFSIPVSPRGTRMIHPSPAVATC